MIKISKFLLNKVCQLLDLASVLERNNRFNIFLESFSCLKCVLFEITPKLGLPVVLQICQISYISAIKYFFAWYKYIRR